MQYITKLTTGDIRIDNNDYGVAIQHRVRRAVTQAEIDANNIGALIWNGTDFVVDQAVIDQKNADDLARSKTKKLSEIKSAFLKERNNTATCQVNINGVKTINAQERSLTDVQTLRQYMTRNNLTTMDYRDVDNNLFPVTLANLDEIQIAIEDNGLAMYQKKWTLESQINDSLIEQDLLSILW